MSRNLSTVLTGFCWGIAFYKFLSLGISGKYDQANWYGIIMVSLWLYSKALSDKGENE